MRKTISILLVILLLALPVYAERAHIGDNLTTDDLTSHIVGTANQITVTEVADTAVLSTPQSIGTTSNVLFNSVEATAGIQFGLTNVPTHSEGALHWDDEERTLELDTEVTNFHFLIGQQVLVRAKNVSGGPLVAGNVVIVSDAAGKRVEITKADADTEPLSDGTLGLVAHSIASNNTGYVVTEGILNGVDTSAFSEGDTLYLSSTAGGITNVPVVAPKHGVTLGKCTRSHSSDGRIYVRIHEGVEIGELHDVLISSVANNNILKYDSGDARWENSNAVTLANASITNVSIGNTVVGSGIDLDVMNKTAGDGASTVRINGHGNVAQLNIAVYNGVDGVFATNGQVALQTFTRSGNATTYGFLKYFADNYSVAASRGDFHIQTQTVGEIYLKPVGQQAFKADSSRNIYTGADLTATTAMVNSIGVATGECGTTNPSTYATLCVEPVTTAAGTTAKVMRARHGDGNETTLTSLYGNIYTATNATVAITGFAFANVSGVSNGGTARGMTENGTSGYITALNTGVYHVQANLSMSGGIGLNNQTVNGRIAINGTPTNYGFKRKISTGADVGSAGANGLLSLSANDRVSLMLNSTASGEDITAEMFSLTIDK